MKLLLDTHILLWILFQESYLPERSIEYLTDPQNQLYYSTASIWEIETKYLIHREQMPFTAAQVLAYCGKAKLRNLPMMDRHVLNLKNLQRKAGSPPHKDPFDRMLVCQAMTENMRFLTHDRLLGDYEEAPIIIV